MSNLVLLQFGLSLLSAILGGAAGWWLRGRPTDRSQRRRHPDRQQVASQVLQSLQSAADTVRSCIEQHTECIRTIQNELQNSTSTEPAIITNAAAAIIESNGLVRHQIDGIRSSLDDKRREIQDCLSSTDGLLFTFASLDRQTHIYGQVLSSLEALAVELANEVKGHDQRLKSISDELQDESQNSLAGVTNAVTRILDATEEVRHQLAAKEERIAVEAKSLHMQAVLTHTDLLTSLPNRRALESEMQRASSASARARLCTLLLVDLDDFQSVNKDYGHQGGDVILRQAASMLKQLVRGRDMVARYGGDCFAILMPQTTLHDALPIAERVREVIEQGQFSHGTSPRRLTASVGVAQLHEEEIRALDASRSQEALLAAQQAGGNQCFRHDGTECHRVSTVFQSNRQQAKEESLSLASFWRDSTTPSTTGSTSSEPVEIKDPTLSGRSLFAANLNRRLAEWKRGGECVSVAVIQVDQMEALISRFGDEGRNFLRQVLSRLLEAVTRDMDERCEFDDGLYALLLPGTDEPSALAVADRLRSQVAQCKVRMGSDLWDLTASIGVAHCNVAARVMDIMLSAESAMRNARQEGGNAVHLGEPVQSPQAARQG